MLNEVKHLAIAREILPLRLRSGLKARFAQNDIVHHLTYDKALCALLIIPEQELKPLAKCKAGAFAHLGNHRRFGKKLVFRSGLRH